MEFPGRKEESEGCDQASMVGVRSDGASQQPSSRVSGHSKSRLVPRGMMPVICVWWSGMIFLLGYVSERVAYLVRSQ
jgi:hypothetical protein